MRKFHNFNLLGAVILFTVACRAPQPMAGKFKEEWQKGKEGSSSVFVLEKKRQ